MRHGPGRRARRCRVGEVLVIVFVIVLLGPLVPFSVELLVVLAQVRFGFGGQFLADEVHGLAHDGTEPRVGDPTLDEQRIVAVCPLAVVHGRVQGGVELLVEFRQLFPAVELGHEQLFGEERHASGHGIDDNDEAAEQCPKGRVVDNGGHRTLDC